MHIRRLSDGELAYRMQPFFIKAGYPENLALLERIAPLIRERLVGLDEAPEWGGMFFEETVRHNVQDLIAKGLTAAESAQAARRALAVLEGLTEWSHAAIEEPLRLLSEELGLKPGQFFGILRAAITGRTVSPPLFESMEIFGRDKVLQRLREAIRCLETG
jgi:glutamyl-tRNA synthetase